MVVPAIAMPERIAAYQQRKTDHTDLKDKIMNDIDSKKRETGKE
jgi:hypothetical protein